MVRVRASIWLLVSKVAAHANIVLAVVLLVLILPLVRIRIMTVLLCGMAVLVVV